MAFLEKTELQVNSFLKVSYIYHVLSKNLSGNFKQQFKRYNNCFYKNWFLKLILKFVSCIDVWVLFARGHFSCLNRPQFFSRVAIWGSKNIGAISSQSINIATQYALRRKSFLRLFKICYITERSSYDFPSYDQLVLNGFIKGF